MEGTIFEDDASDFDASGDTHEERQRRRTANDLVLLARFALMDPEGHPVTHICGVPIEEVKQKAENYAEGINMGSDYGQKYPW